MANATEGKYAGEFLIDDEGNEESRDNVVVLSGQTLSAGHVVGRLDRGVGGLAIPVVSGTGNGTMTKLVAGPDVQEGNYVVKCKTAVTNGGVFSVTAPDGTALPDLTLTPGSGNTTAYVSSHLSFSITENTDFAVNDTFTVAVAASTSATVVGTGNGTVTGIALGPDAKFGQYTVTVTGAVTNGGVVSITAPDGTVVVSDSITAGAGGTLVVTSSQISLTVTDGATDFAKGDTARIVVFNKLVKKVVEWDPRPTAYDGRHKVAGVAWDNYDASAGDVKGAIVARRAVVNAAELTFKSTLSVAEQAAGRAGLLAIGIVSR